MSTEECLSYTSICVKNSTKRSKKIEREGNCYSLKMKQDYAERSEKEFFLPKEKEFEGRHSQEEMELVE